MTDAKALLLAYFPLSALLITITALFMGLFVYIKDRKNITYLILCTVTSIWGVSYFMWQISTTAETALLHCRMLMIGTILMPITFLHFIIEFLEKNMGIHRKVLFYGYILSFFSLLFIFQPLYVRGVEKRLFFEFWPIPGPLFHFIVAQYSASWLYVVALLYKEYRNSKGIRRRRAMLVFCSILLCYFGGIPNFSLWYNIPVAPYTLILVSFYIIALSYVVLKYRHI